MARFDRGFFTVDRETLAKFGNDHYLWAVWLYINSAANIYESTVKRGRKILKISPGELLITVEEIATELNLARNTVKRCLKVFKDLGLMTSRCEYHCQVLCLIPCKGHCKPIQRKEDVDYENSVEASARTSVETSARPHIELKIKEEKRKRGGEERIPPSTQSFSSLLKSGSQDAKADISPEGLDGISVELNALEIEWARRVSRIARAVPWSDFKERRALKEMIKLYTLPELRSVFRYLESSNSKLAREFIRPSDFRLKFFGSLSYLDAAYREVSSPKESKTGKKVPNIEEIKKRVLEKMAL